MTRRAPRSALAVAAFWRAAGFDRWFAVDPAFDALTRARLGRLHEAAAGGGLDHWDETPEGALALLILLDQAPRNMFRGGPRAFATDAIALAVAEAALARGFDRRVAKGMRWFFYLPFEHSEDPAAQALCISLFAAMNEPEGVRYAQTHADVIARFGRFPHRNDILGRSSTSDERRFLAEGGFSG
ncbi:DUF924 family protein [Methylopila sp. M107]|uniref:DUF924 family protein n=1 Tax=Methylopila sp. M107 TaxID=1101190 RepID=UPI000360241D|nr:DUF924 family protein [Methylopila sp. M107]